MTKALRIGTRGSPLALAQAHQVRRALQAEHPDLATPGLIEIEVITTTGDRDWSKPLRVLGGKGLFTKEIDLALAAGEIDLAVHSTKDVPTVLPEGQELVAVLPRADPRDAVLCAHAASFAALPSDAVVGTSSLRRGAQVKMLRPDLRIAPMRGNVETRLRKLAPGAIDATLLAVAGLQRLGRADLRYEILPVEVMLPAVCQGTIGIAARSDDTVVRDRLAAICCPQTWRATLAERALLTALDGSCQTPIAGYARPDPLDGDALRLDALVALPDGSEHHAVSMSGCDAVALGAEAGGHLRECLTPPFANLWAAG